MTKEDLQQIGDLLKPKFDKIDEKFDKIDKTIENLAISTQKGFEEARKYTDKKFIELRFNMEEQLDPIKQDIKIINMNINKMEKELEEIKIEVKNIKRTENEDIGVVAHDVSILKKNYEKLASMSERIIEEMAKIKNQIKLAT